MAEPVDPIFPWDTEHAVNWEDSVVLLLCSVEDVVVVSDWGDRVGFAVDVILSASQQMRNHDTIPADPFYDADAEPITPELMMLRLPAGYMYAVGIQLFVAGGGTIEDWEAKTLGEKCAYIQDYT